MVKGTRLPYTACKRVRGALTWYYRRGSTWVKLPGDPGKDAEAAKLYWAARTGAHQRKTAMTFNALIESYRASPRWQRIAPKTRREYERMLAYISDKVGDHSALRIERRHVIKARDDNAHRPAAANKIVTMLSVLLEHAIDLGWRRDNPAKGVEHFKGGEGHKPWPTWAIANFRAVAAGPERTAFELCLGTGQRIGDVLAMRWDDIEGDEIFIKQSKTGTELWVPFTDDLRAYLEALPRGLRTTIVCNHLGEPYAYRNWHKLFDRSRTAAGAEAFMPHGLRYNAASELYEAGCTDAQVQAITGHKTRAMAAKYGKGARQKVLAREARDRLK
jgi:integrase